MVLEKHTGTQNGCSLYAYILATIAERENPQAKAKLDSLSDPKTKETEVIVYFSGDGAPANPEIILRDEATIMFTFWDNRNKPEAKFRRIHKERKRHAKKLRQSRTPHSTFGVRAARTKPT